MSYRCGLCHRHVEHNVKMKKHVVHREVKPSRYWSRTQTADGVSRVVQVETPMRKEVDKEIPVCNSCQAAIADGVLLKDLIR